jgi:hypothetical protein
VAGAGAASLSACEYRHINVHRHYSFALRDPDVPGEISRGLSAALGVVSNFAALGQLGQPVGLPVRVHRVEI